MISRWKKEFLENSAAAFETPKMDDAAFEKQKDRYLRKIVDLEMQLDFAKRVSRQLWIEIPANDRFPMKARSASRSSARFLD
jgi:hypothetical protein